jgi:hypothetical protein
MDTVTDDPNAFIALVEAFAKLLANPWTWVAIVVLVFLWFVKNHSGDMAKATGDAVRGWFAERAERAKLQNDIIRAQVVEADMRAKEATSRAASAELAENEARSAHINGLQSEIARYREDIARGWERVRIVEEGQRDCLTRERQTSQELATMRGTFSSMKEQFDKSLHLIEELTTQNRDLRMSLEITQRLQAQNGQQPNFVPPTLPNSAG